REFAHDHIIAGLARLLLGEATGRHLRLREDWAGDRAVVHLRLVAQAVLRRDDPFVRRHVRQRGGARYDIADRVDVRDAGLHLLVADNTATVALDSNSLQSNLAQQRFTPDAYEDHVALDRH